MNTPFVIAEAGVNHNGDLARAVEMVHAAASAGADYVKFQAFRADEIVARDCATAEYQKLNTGTTDQFNLLKNLELDLDDFGVLASECRKAGTGFLCTPFDVSMAPALIEIGMDRIKIPSGEITNTPMLQALGALELPVLLSTGMSDIDEVDAAVGTLREAGCRDITLFHCTSCYPAPPDTLNLQAIRTMAEHSGLPVGYSDHSLGDHAAIAAVALGAVAIEKHFTLDRDLPGPDHAASLEADELARMVQRLRDTAEMLGDGIKRPARGEAETAALVRRSWHTTRDLPPGHRVTSDDIVLLRPAVGLQPSRSPVGRVLAVPVGPSQPICPEHLERKT